MMSLGRAVIHETETKPVRVGVRLHVLDQCDDDVLELAVDRLDAVDRRAEHRELLGQVAGVELAAKKGFQPAAGKPSYRPVN
jgi:hypothetical protein